mmetsp:Transcript_3554/g.12595  ORF Transcript_3554/g.12595 Transcript_3554/m.12595 type:complete len:119 (+) Transcript_3554:1366-1722(+)
MLLQGSMNVCRATHFCNLEGSLSLYTRRCLCHFNMFKFDSMLRSNHAIQSMLCFFLCCVEELKEEILTITNFLLPLQSEAHFTLQIQHHSEGESMTCQILKVFPSPAIKKIHFQSTAL